MTRTEVDRRLEICPPKKIEAWLRYDFPGREREAMKYSKMKWRAEHFNGTDWDQRRQKHAIYKLIDDPATHPMPNAKITRISETSKSRYSFFSKLSSSTSKKSSASSSVQPPVRSTAVSPIKRRGKGWAEDVDDQNGNNDYLMFSNIDYTHADVRQDVKAWGEWMLSNDVGVAGFRLDAVQHISYSFMREWIQHVNNASVKSKRKDAFIIGEVWSGEPERITKWLDAVQHASGHPRIHAFDAPLLYNFSHLTDAVHHQATTKIRDNTNIQTRSSSNARASSMNPKDANLDSARNPSLISPSHPPPDLRNLAKNSILELRPEAAVTVVTNHDTQTGQTSYTPMEPKLKILFYAFVLLRQEGLPCVFWGDLFGTQGPYPEPPIGVVNAARSKGQRSLLADLLVCRKIFAYGTQMLYSWAASTVGWTRSGVPDRSGSGCAVILNIEPRDPAVGAKALNMKIGRPGEVWVDALMPDGGGVQIDGKGWGAFPVMTPGVRVFVRSDAQGVEKFPVELNLDVYGL